MNVLNSAPKPNDVPLEPGPTDSVTRIEFNPVVDYLAVGSWDNQVSPCLHNKIADSYLS
jgi:WD40 repeat protein